MTMLKVVYLVNLRRGKCKALGYAISLTKALSGELSITVPPRPGVNHSPGFELKEPRLSVVSRLNKKSVDKHALPFSGSVRVKPDLIITGKRTPAGMAVIGDCVPNWDIGARRNPTLFVPYGYAFNGARRILFTGNVPGMMDEPLLHLIVSAFLPSAWQLDGSDLKRIHWNNVSLLPETYPNRQPILPVALAQRILHHEIDLIVMPLQTSPEENIKGWQQKIIREVQAPILVFPGKTRCTDIQPIETKLTGIAR